MKSFFISLFAALSVAVLSYCFRLNQFDVHPLELDLTWDDLSDDLWFKRYPW